MATSCAGNAFGTTKGGLMSTIEKTIDVDVPLHTAYDQWTQFETFPEFMEGVEDVRQIDDTHVHWKAEIAGVTREWDAEIVNQMPDQQLTWRSTDGTTNGGTVSFAPAEPGTRVTLRLDFEPEGILEKAGDVLGIVERRAEGDLERFKSFIEERGTETGAWRGEVSQGEQVTGLGTDPGAGPGAGPGVGPGVGTGEGLPPLS
jgi:uncharacterized membrane protein